MLKKERCIYKTNFKQIKGDREGERTISIAKKEDKTDRERERTNSVAKREREGMRMTNSAAKTYIKNKRQTDRQAERQTDRDSDRGGEAERQTDRQRQRDRKPVTEREVHSRRRLVPVLPFCSS